MAASKKIGTRSFDIKEIKIQKKNQNENFRWRISGEKKTFDNILYSSIALEIIIKKQFGSVPLAALATQCL